MTQHSLEYKVDTQKHLEHSKIRKSWHKTHAVEMIFPFVVTYVVTHVIFVPR